MNQEASGLATAASDSDPSLKSAGAGGGLTAMEFLEKYKIWIIIGVVTALLLLALVQAIITMNRIKKRRAAPGSNTKVRDSSLLD